MKELTRIITAEITVIERHCKDDLSDILDKFEYRQYIANLLKDVILSVDDIFITKIQDFVRDKDEK